MSVDTMMLDLEVLVALSHGPLDFAALADATRMEARKLRLAIARLKRQRRIMLDGDKRWKVTA
jgi:DNA-binding IclR family transcriptional regulator